MHASLEGAGNALNDQEIVAGEAGERVGLGRTRGISGIAKISFLQLGVCTRMRFMHFCAFAILLLTFQAPRLTVY